MKKLKMPILDAIQVGGKGKEEEKDDETELVVEKEEAIWRLIKFSTNLKQNITTSHIEDFAS